MNLKLFNTNFFSHPADKEIAGNKNINPVVRHAALTALRGGNFFLSQAAARKNTNSTRWFAVLS
ncbi:MAG: hypothetical protein ACFB0E_02015 [Leptolyngbyaceae cyanobacterium]